MAGNWIKMRTDLHDDPRVRAVAKALRCNVCTVTGALHYLWSLADQYTVDGVLKTYDAPELDQRVGLPGFAAALAHPDVDWLEIGHNFIRVKRFEEHNGESGKTRAQTARRVANHRERNRPVTPPPLPEKRRGEEIREEESGARASGDDRDAAEPEVTAAVEAFDRWSHVARGHGLQAEANEVRRVEELADALSQDTIEHGGTLKRRHLFIPRVVETLVADHAKFPTINYALTCVRNRLAEWSRAGVPGAQQPHARDRPPTKVELAKQRISQTRKPESAGAA